MEQQQTVTQADMTFHWRVEGDHLYGEIRGPGRGWVTVGFNDVPHLAGSRLIMGAVLEDGSVRVEEHVADPPRHHMTHQLYEGCGGVQDPDGTAITFALPLASDIVALEPGATYHLILAWSHSDDFNHHSTWRTSASISAL